MSAADTLRKCVALLKQVDFADCAESEALWHQHGLVLQEAEAVLRDGEKQTDLAKRLLFKANHADSSNICVLKADLIAICCEANRYYTGMVSWKKTAEAKDAAAPAPSLQAVGAELVYKCHIDLDEGQEADDCVLDGGVIDHCFYARKYGADARTQCGQWKPVKIIPPQPAAAPSGDVDLSKLTRFGWTEAYIGESSELVEDTQGPYVKFADVLAAITATKE